VFRVCERFTTSSYSSSYAWTIRRHVVVFSCPLRGGHPIDSLASLDFLRDYAMEMGEILNISPLHDETFFSTFRRGLAHRPQPVG